MITDRQKISSVREKIVEPSLVFEQAVGPGGISEGPAHLAGDAQAGIPLGQSLFCVSLQKGDHLVWIKDARTEIGLFRCQKSQLTPIQVWSQVMTMA